jgi:hypothetical protein
MPAPNEPAVTAGWQGAAIGRLEDAGAATNMLSLSMCLVAQDTHCKHYTTRPNHSGPSLKPRQPRMLLLSQQQVMHSMTQYHGWQPCCSMVGHQELS